MMTRQGPWGHTISDGIFLRLGLILLAGAFVGSCGAELETAVAPRYQAEIKRTSYGIPHITADDFASLGFGEGYAAAEDQACNIADGIITARGERARFHGPGENSRNLKSDIVVRALGIPADAARNFAAQPRENQDWIRGYAAGFNKYIRAGGRQTVAAWCRGAAWVREIMPEDVLSRFQTLAQSGPRMSDMILAATPPASAYGAASGPASGLDRTPPSPEVALDGLEARHLGSNGWAFGRERTENGRGLLMANPHYPWYGTDRFWEKHLTIPGKLDVYGVHLVGAPGVAIGFNENVAWTHTVSASERVTFYKLDLLPDDPTRYYYDGEIRRMTAKTVSVPVRTDDGFDRVEEHTVWFSHYGPMVALADVPWTATQAVTMRDANFDNQDLLSQWKAMAQAGDMDAFKAAHETWNAMPWVNTMAASRDGRAVYIDGSNVGRLSEQAIALWRSRSDVDPLTQTFHDKMGLVLLDGSDSRFEWQSHPEARAPGVVPYAEQPKQERTDYIFNANDSHWLTHVDAPLSGYSPLYGPEATARSLRTRINAMLVSDTSPDGPAGADGKFSLREAQQALLGNLSLSAVLLREDLVAACRAQSTVRVDAVPVDLVAACDSLAAYDGRLDLDSRGAVLFREWITQYPRAQYTTADALFAVPFDPQDPLNTPRGLADKGRALQNLARAVGVLQNAGLSFDATLRQTQMARRGSHEIAIHGGGNAEGVANIIGHWNYDSGEPQSRAAKIAGSRDLTAQGYMVNAGSSFVMGVSYTDAGPRAQAFLTYGQSDDPAAVHYSDQTRLFSRKAWRPILFRPAAIDRDLQRAITVTDP